MGAPKGVKTNYYEGKDYYIGSDGKAYFYNTPPAPPQTTSVMTPVKDTNAINPIKNPLSNGGGIPNNGNDQIGVGEWYEIEGHITEDGTNGFGGYTSEKRGGSHLGADLAITNEGSIIKAIYEGVVKYQSSSSANGNYVVIEHKMIVDGKEYIFYSFYAHMKEKAKVKVGQVVSAGTELGIMGTTGNSTGEHLHLGIFTGPAMKNPYGANKVNGVLNDIGNTARERGYFDYTRDGVLRRFYDPMKVIETKGQIIIDNYYEKK